MLLVESAMQVLTSPVTGALIVAALALILVRRGLEEAADGPASSTTRVFDLPTVCLLVIFATAVTARFLTLFD
jgi:hypothetical protein